MAELCDWTQDMSMPLKTAISDLGVCPCCWQVYEFHTDGPFATCGCGTCEWTSPPTVLERLRRSLNELEKPAYAVNLRQRLEDTKRELKLARDDRDRWREEATAARRNIVRRGD